MSIPFPSRFASGVRIPARRAAGLPLAILLAGGLAGCDSTTTAPLALETGAAQLSRGGGGSTGVQTSGLSVGLHLTPAVDTLRAVGDTVRLTATVVLQNANQGSPPVQWASLDTAVATVDGAGLVTATGAGVAPIVASSRNFADTARIHVQTSAQQRTPEPEPAPAPAPAPAPTPPAGGGSGAWPNEPAGFTAINDQPWSALPGSGSTWGANPGGTLAIVSDPTAPRSGPSVIRATVHAGSDGAGSQATWHNFGAAHRGYSELYFAVWYKFPKEWENHRVGTKSLWPGIDGVTNQVYTWFDNPSMLIGINMQGQPWGNRNLHAHMGPASHQTFAQWRDQWVRIEYYLKMNTVNSRNGDPYRADGVVRIWVTAGGQTHQIANFEDVKFLGVNSQGQFVGTNGVISTGKFDHMKWDPVYGGMGSPAPRDMHNFIDHIYVSGR